MNKNIISAVIGGGFFATTSVMLGLECLYISLPIGIAAYVASSLVLSDNKKDEIKDTRKNLYDVLKEAKTVNEEIYSVMGKIEDKKLVENIKEIHDTTSKIINTVSKNPEKLKQASSFFSYYLPVTLKILIKYDEVENQRLESKNSKEFMTSVKDMISKTNLAFKSQLSNLYHSDMIDTDAEMKVLDTMLKTEGYSDINDFDILK